MVDEGQRSCGYVLEVMLMAYSWPKPLTPAKGKELNPQSKQAGTWGSAAHEYEAQHRHPTPMAPTVMNP